MNSKSSGKELNLDRDLPTSLEDCRALRKIKRLPRMNLEAYLKFLEAFGHTSCEILRARKGPSGPPFKLHSIRP